MVLLRSAGQASLTVAEVAGGMVLTAARALRAVVTLRVPPRECLRQLAVCGTECLPVTVFASVCVGCIVAVQGMTYAQRYSAPEVFGWAAYFSAVREVGPLLMGLTMGSRLGSFHAAQLATLRVTERVDALEALGVDSHAVLVAPRLLAMPVAGALLMAWADGVALAAATLFAWALGGVTPWTTWGSIQDYSQWSDLVQGLWKAAAYALCTALCATSVGMAARGGADAVGHAVTRTAVTSILAVAGLNHALTVWLTSWR